MALYVMLAMLSMAGPADAFERLSNANQEIRDRAFLEVDKQRLRLEEAMLQQLERVLDKRDSAYLGRTHTVLQAIAATRADNTVHRLVEVIDLTLDPVTFPLGVRRKASAYYPVAEALRDIGNKSVIAGIIGAAAREDREEKVLRIYAWVLIEVLGKDVARLAIERGKKGHSPEEQERIERLRVNSDAQVLIEIPAQKP